MREGSGSVHYFYVDVVGIFYFYRLEKCRIQWKQNGEIRNHAYKIYNKWEDERTI